MRVELTSYAWEAYALPMCYIRIKGNSWLDSKLVEYYKLLYVSQKHTVVFTRLNGLPLMVLFVELPGFEPGISEPKSDVLPLHHSSISIYDKSYAFINSILLIFFSFNLTMQIYT